MYSKMCEPIICGSVLTLYALGFGGMGLLSVSRNRRSRLKRNIHSLVSRYYRQGISSINVDEVLNEDLQLGWQAKRVVRDAHSARDQILFGDVPPNVKSAGKYVTAQRTIRRLDDRLLYVLDPMLLLATQRSEPLLMSSDLSSCRDGTYRTSVEFAAGYRNLVGEDAFQVRKEWHQKGNKLEGKEPWYAERADYLSRLVNSTTNGKDIF